MISDEKAIHIIHLMLDGIEKQGMVSYPKKDEAVRESKKATLLFLKNLGNSADAARQRILSQKNPPPEGSPQWENLYQKYYEEELNRRGG